MAVFRMHHDYRSEIRLPHDGEIADLHPVAIVPLALGSGANTAIFSVRLEPATTLRCRCCATTLINRS